MTNWPELIERLGFPIAITLIIFYIGWRGARWFGNQIIVPLRDAHINFLAALQSTQRQQADSLDRLTFLHEQHTVETSYIRQLLEANQNKRPQ